MFHPGENISREQMAVMIDRALEYKKVNRTKWSADVHRYSADSSDVSNSCRS